MSALPLTRLLIANRGEIACRIMRTARSLGIASVAVHSAVDQDARHVREADDAVNIGGSRASESYLKIDALVDAALRSGAQAVHPGYGFLSENAAFATAVEAAGLIFVGPPASAIEAMGSKSAAKALMADAGVPLVPGYHGADQDLETFRAAAARIGYPVLLKASAGGGGKGMKVVEREADLDDALASARREAQASFGDARLLLEQYVVSPRHVEIQVFADHHGHCLYLNERDCSIQRRHQKVVEEAPAPGLSPVLRQAMGEAAVRAAQAIGYVGAGTVEFLLDARGDFFFMEMNTRLQVEHPVTEAITGLDLVAWQLQVASGAALPMTQAEVPLHGHAIEVRLYAEDPANDFLPSTGRLAVYREAPPGAGQRIDSGVDEGDNVSPFYDPMLGKLIAWGETREQARLRLLQMLAAFRVGGVRTNLAFLQRILAHPAFAQAELDTGFIERHRTTLFPEPAPLPAAFWQRAVQAWLGTTLGGRDEATVSPWTTLTGWRAGALARSLVHLECDGQRQWVELEGNARPLRLRVRPEDQPVRRGDHVFVPWSGAVHAVSRVDPQALVNADEAEAGGLTAPMNGSIVRVLVDVGEQVPAGATLVVVEAMKMEHSLRAPHAGVVSAVLCQEGELVHEGRALVVLDAAP